MPEAHVCVALRLRLGPLGGHLCVAIVILRKVCGKPTRATWAGSQLFHLAQACQRRGPPNGQDLFEAARDRRNEEGRAK